MKSAHKWMAEHSNGEYVLSQEVFIDDGKSASKGKNIEKDAQGRAKGELERFIQCVEQGKIKRGSILLIDEYSRFSRLPTAESLGLFSRVISKNIGLVFTGSHEKRAIDNALLAKEPHLLYFIIGEMIRSYTETAERSRKIISAKATKKAFMMAGNVVAHNNVPKYFTYVPFSKTHGKYVHNENTAIVKELAQNILSGKSLYSIADALNARQVKTFRRGYQWSGNSIRAILKNRTLIGEYLGNKHFVPPIISEDEFNKVQNILRQNIFSRGKRGEVVNIFRGVCFCADCGKSMSVSTQKLNYHTGVKHKAPYRYLRCSVMGKHVACKNRKTIRLPVIELEFFYNFLFKSPYDMLNDNTTGETKELNAEIAAKQAQLNKLNEGIDDAAELIGSYPKDALKVKLAKLTKESDTVKAELDALNASVSKVHNTPDNRQWMLKISQFGEGEGGKDIEHVIYTDTLEKIDEALSDNRVREQIRMKLPLLIGKMTVDTMKGQFYVYNHSEKIIYTSSVIKSQKNNSAIWRKSLKEWGKRPKVDRAARK